MSGLGAYTFKIHTFGCKVNTYDSGLIQKNLLSHGMKLDDTSLMSTKVHVLNTCAVTAEATKEATKVIRRIKAKEPFSKIIVTGCGAQVDTEVFQNSAADLVVANSHKSQLPFIMDQYFKGQIQDKVFKSNIFKKEDLEAGGGLEESHTRSFLKIQDGCNSFCTYCVIPYARGKSRSIAIADLVHRVNELYQMGTREVVLTGVHIGDYEDVINGKKMQLEDLVQALLQKTTMPRFRLSSLEPVEVTDRLLDLYSNSRLCPHFHMSIQSAHTEVLARMKRKYTKDDVQLALTKISQRVKNAFVGMDVIVGFPGESHEFFEDTFLTLAELPWNRIHVFPYSERNGTRAVNYDNSVPIVERMRRSERLRELSSTRFDKTALEQIGKIKDSLILKKNALSEDYWTIEIDEMTANKSFEFDGKQVKSSLEDQITDELHIKPGEIHKVKITGFKKFESKMDGILVGEVQWT